MKYIIYYKEDKVKIPGFKINMITKNKHIWPEDNTEIEISIDNNKILSYTISNLSDRTQYLYDEGLLGIGIFVQENPSWLSRKTYWRSELSQSNHLDRRNIAVIPINSLSGTIDLKTMGWYNWSGAWSWSLNYKFDKAANYQDPYVSSGTENIAVGIGRYYDYWAGFRPHKVSDYAEVIVENKL